MAKLFISYRRDDTAGLEGRIYDRLIDRFGPDSVFWDVHSIPAGIDFRRHLESVIGTCDALLALIGGRWLDASKDAVRRLDDPNDFVRIELEYALGRDIPVVPVLLGWTEMPAEVELPPGLAPLAYRNAVRVDIGRDFHPHMDRLIAELSQLTQAAPLKACTPEIAPDDWLRPSRPDGKFLKLWRSIIGDQS